MLLKEWSVDPQYHITWEMEVLRCHPRSAVTICLVLVREAGTDEEILHYYTPSTILNAFHALMSFILTMKLGLREFVHLLSCV